MICVRNLTIHHLFGIFDHIHHPPMSTITTNTNFNNNNNITSTEFLGTYFNGLCSRRWLENFYWGQFWANTYLILLGFYGDFTDGNIYLDAGFCGDDFSTLSELYRPIHIFNVLYLKICM